MCHILLLAPLWALVLFAFLPWREALPPYVIIAAGSLAVYWKVMLSQRRRPETGKRSMVGDHARVLKVQGRSVDVRYHGELWRAISSAPLEVGQEVVIHDVEGLTLMVSPLPPDEKGGP